MRHVRVSPSAKPSPFGDIVVGPPLPTRFVFIPPPGSMGRQFSRCRILKFLTGQLSLFLQNSQQNKWINIGIRNNLDRSIYVFDCCEFYRKKYKFEFAKEFKNFFPFSYDLIWFKNLRIPKYFEQLNETLRQIIFWSITLSFLNYLSYLLRINLLYSWARFDRLHSISPGIVSFVMFSCEKHSSSDSV